MVLDHSSVAAVNDPVVPVEANGQVSNVIVNGAPINVKGDGPHVGHGIGLHAAPMSTVDSSSTVKAGGKFVIREGDNANCGHPHVAGSGDTNAG